jgi:hypothetical protein
LQGVLDWAALAVIGILACIATAVAVCGVLDAAGRP